MKLRPGHWATLGALSFSAVFFWCTMVGMALEERYAQGWDLLRHRDEIPWWDLLFHPILSHVLLFPLGLIADELDAHWLFVMGSVPVHGAFYGWLWGRRKVAR